MDRIKGKVRQFFAGGAALVLAGNAAIFSGSFAMQTRNPTMALKLNPSNPVAMVRKAQHTLAIGSAGESSGVSALAAAKQSIRLQPLNAPAFRLYGLVRVANADLDAISAQIAMSDRLSRRDVRAQLFLIEDAVRRNDIAEALRHYDTAMRVDGASRALLFPILTDALTEPLIRQKFKPYLANPPPWLDSFLRNAISTSKDPSNLAALAIEAGGFPEGQEYGSIHTELMVALEATGELPQLVRYYRSIGDASQDVLTSVAFTERGTDRAIAPVSWLPYTTDGINSIFISTGRSDLELETVATPGFAGIIARKLTALPSGRFNFRAPMRATNFRAADSIRWQINCPDKDSTRELLNVSAGLKDQFTIGGNFTVPADCPVQRIELFLNTSFGPGSLILTMASPSLVGL